VSSMNFFSSLLLYSIPCVWDASSYVCPLRVGCEMREQEKNGIWLGLAYICCSAGDDRDHDHDDCGDGDGESSDMDWIETLQ